MKLRIILPWPVRALSPNGRCHWSAKNRAVQKARLDGFLASTDAMRRCGWKKVNAATVRATFRFVKPNRRDGDNHLAMLKPYLDGFADAGVIANDSGFRHEPVKFEKSDEKCVVVEIEEALAQ